MRAGRSWFVAHTPRYPPMHDPPFAPNNCTVQTAKADQGLTSSPTSVNYPGYAISMKNCLLLILAGLVLSGCLSRPSVVKEAFAFSAAPAPARPGPGQGPVLAIRPVGVAPPFDSQSFNYLTGPSSYERDFYAQFLVPPGEALA